MGTFNGNPQLACIDSAVDKNAHNQPVKLWPCHNQGGNQVQVDSISLNCLCLSFELIVGTNIKMVIVLLLTS